MKPPKNWLVDHCAMCGSRHPWTQNKYPNIKSRQVLCICETRRPPDQPTKPASEMTQADWERVGRDVFAQMHPPKGGREIEL